MTLLAHITGSKPLWRALFIALVYLVVAGLWLSFSDAVFTAVFTNNPYLEQILKIKEWVFVVISALVLMAYVWWQLHLSDSNKTHFRQLAENIREVFWVGSPDWRQVYYISQAYEDIWGKTPQSLYDDPGSWMASVHPDDQQRVLNDVPKDISQIKDYVDFSEYRIVRPDNSIRWIKARAFPIRDNNGNIL